MDDTIRDLLAAHAGLQTPPSALAPDADLYGAGMTSFATVQLMLALEEAFDVEFPEDRLNAKTFTSIASIRAALADAGVKEAAWSVPVADGSAHPRAPRHPLHAADRAWPETNCYADLWIEVLAHLGHEPRAAFGFTVAQEWEGDHFTFFKPPLEDLEALYGLRVDEMAIYDGVPTHVAQQLALGRMVTVEVDSFYLPDTQGVSYRTEHGKTTIAVAGIDRAGKTLDYFHGVGRHRVEGEDWDGVFLTDAPADRPFLPYAEVVKPNAAPAAANLRAEAERLLARHTARAPRANPIRVFQRELPGQVAALAERPFAMFHLYAFNTLRQTGANFELLSSHLDWLGDAAGAAPALKIAQTAKGVQFQLARALAKRKFDTLPAALEPAADAWDALLARLRARVG